MLFRLLPMLLVIGLAAGEAAPTTEKVDTVFWSKGVTIDVPVRLSAQGSIIPRTIDLPKPVAEIAYQWDVDAANQPVVAEHRSRTVFIQLWDPSFDAILPVIDVDGNVYNLHIRPVAEGDNPTNGLLVKRPDAEGEPASPGQVGGDGMDLDGALAYLGRVMETGMPDPLVTIQKLNTFERGKRYAGQYIFKSDLLSIVGMRKAVMGRYEGYEVQFRWRGNDALTLPIQRYKYPGKKATGFTRLGIAAMRSDGEVVLQPHSVVTVYFMGIAQGME